MTDNVKNSIRLFKYKDKYYLPTRTTVEFMQEFEDMELREDDIFVCTYPKSGTHWMQEIVALILANGAPEKVLSMHRRIVTELVDLRSPTEDAIRATGPVLREFKDCPSPRLLTTHVPCPLLPRQRKEKHCKVIYVYRHPKDTIVSQYNFQRVLMEEEIGRPVSHTPEQFADFFDVLITGKRKYLINRLLCNFVVDHFDYNSWFDHLKQYFKHKDDPDFFFVSFEDMKKDVSQVVKDLVSFLGRELDEDGFQKVVENSSFTKMRANYTEYAKDMATKSTRINPSIFFNKGTLKQWRHLFTAEQSEKFDKLFYEHMKDCKFTKEYSMTE